MSNRAWMPLHIDDYLADTGHLTGAEHGAYMLMIMHYWQNGSLPENERLIARIARMDASQWAESRDVLAMLFGENWTHKRIDAELTKADVIIEKRRAAADARHGKRKPDASAMQMQSKCSDTGVLPSTDNQEDVGSDEPTSPEPAKAAPVASSSVFIELPCVSGEPYPISETDVAEWRTAFPAVDISQQLNAARQWLIANPTRRKTRRGMRKFIVSWMDRRQNAAHSPPSSQANAPPRRETPFDALADISRLKGWTDEPGSLPGNNQDDQRIPPLGGGPPSPVVDLRRGHDWHS